MRRRLLLVLVGTVALVLLVHDLPLASHLRGVERDRLVTGLERDAFTLAGRTEEALEGGTAADEPGLRDLVTTYSQQQGVRVVVVDRAGVSVITSDPDEVTGDDFTNRPEIVAALSGAPSTGERDSVTLGESLFFVAVPVLSGDDIVGAVRITAPASAVNDAADERVRGLVVVAGISLLIATAVALVLAETVIRPLSRLRAATHELAGGDLSSRADTSEGPPEVRELALSFNTMADRLEQLIERQRGFAGTASHQLRTPLTALRLRLEQLETRLGSDQVAQADVTEAVAEVDRLHRMIEGLLALTRTEHSAAPPVPVDVGAILAERAEYWRALGEERGVDIVLEASGPPGPWALALDGSLEQIVDNLVDNALEVAPAGSSVRLRAVARDAAVDVHVVDEGPGLDPIQLEQAFDRFWRAPDAPHGGSGLGLAIVRQLAEAAGGTAELRPAPGSGIDAVVTLPPAHQF